MLSPLKLTILTRIKYLKLIPIRYGSMTCTIWCVKNQKISRINQIREETRQTIKFLKLKNSTKIMAATTTNWTPQRPTKAMTTHSQPMNQGLTRILTQQMHLKVLKIKEITIIKTNGVTNRSIKMDSKIIADITNNNNQIQTILIDSTIINRKDKVIRTIEAISNKTESKAWTTAVTKMEWCITTMINKHMIISSTSQQYTTTRINTCKEIIRTRLTTTGTITSKREWIKRAICTTRIQPKPMEMEVLIDHMKITGIEHKVSILMTLITNLSIIKKQTKKDKKTIILR